jgi:hypothetical protein
MTQKALLQSAGDGTAVPAGYVMESQRQSTTLSAATGFTNGTAKNITISPLVLNPGAWEISFNGFINSGSGDTVTQCVFGVSTTSATQPVGNDTFSVPDSNGQIKIVWTGSILNNGFCISIAPYRIVLATQTTFYFVGTAFHTGGTCTLSGSIMASRIA